MDIRKVKKLIEMMEESDIQEIEIKEGEESVRIARGGNVLAAAKVSVPPPATREPDVKEEPPSSATGDIIAAPMVGTFYRAASPSSPAFVEIGGLVKTGDVLCIIESMKMMNQIKADRPGRIEAVLVANATAVGFDQPLFTII